MTHEWHPADEAGKRREEREMQDTLEQRLKFYYGPELPEQPLPESSRLQVFSQLRSQQRSSSQRRRRHLRQPFRRRFRRQPSSFSLPSDVYDALAHVLFAAHMPYSDRLLACRSAARVQSPTMRVALLRRQPLRLTLPTHIALQPVELDVLLAGGLARYEEMRQPTSLLLYVLSLSAITGLLVWTIAALFVPEFSLFTRCLNVFVCLLLIGIGLWLLDLYARHLAQRADITMVRWIGRIQACAGLHALADRNPVPAQRKWGELSLSERIARVCGTRVTIREEHFTLVR